MAASKGEVVEDAREMLRLVSSTRGPRAFRPPGSRGGDADGRAYATVFEETRSDMHTQFRR